MALVREGRIGTEYFGGDLKQLEADIKGEHPSRLGRVLGSLKTVHNEVGKVYALEDQIFKMAAYKKYLAEGMTPKDAAAEVGKWFPDYTDTGRWTRALRNNPLGGPFVSFLDQSIKIAARAAVDRPLRLASILAAPGILSMYSAYALGLSPEEKQLLDDNRNYFQPLLPWRDAYGRVQTVDLMYIMPLANDILPQIRNGVINFGWMLSGPVPQAIGEQKYGVEQFTGKPFIKEEMTAGEEAKVRALATAKTLAPIPSLATYGIERLVGAATGTREETLANAILGTIGGINLRPPYVAEKWVRKTAGNMLDEGLESEAEALLKVYNETYKPRDKDPITMQGVIQGKEQSATAKRTATIKEAARWIAKGSPEKAQDVIDVWNEVRGEQQEIDIYEAEDRAEKFNEE
jgi:hypothetical protein